MTTVAKIAARRLGQLYLSMYHGDIFEDISVSIQEAKKLEEAKLLCVDSETGSYKIADRYHGLAGCMAAEIAIEARKLLLNKLIYMTERYLEESKAQTYEDLIEVWKTKEVPAIIEELDNQYWSQTKVILSLIESNIFEKSQANTKYNLCEIEQKHLRLLDIALECSKYFVAEWVTTKEFYRCSIRRNEDFLVVIVYKFTGEPYEVAREVVKKSNANLSEEEVDSLANIIADDTGIGEEVSAYHIFSLDLAPVTSVDILERLPSLMSEADKAEREQNILVHLAIRYTQDSNS